MNASRRLRSARTRAGGSKPGAAGAPAPAPPAAALL